MPGYYIKSVSPDGYCIIHAVVEALAAVGRPVTFNNVSSSLRIELQKEQYQETWVPSGPLFLDLINTFDEFMHNPLANYDQDITDLFFEALAMIHKVNITIFQSDSEKCDIIHVNMNKDSNSFQHTLYFVRTLSLHFDPVIPITDNTETDTGPDNSGGLLISVNQGGAKFPTKDGDPMEINSEVSTKDGDPMGINIDVSIIKDEDPIDISSDDDEVVITGTHFVQPSNSQETSIDFATDHTQLPPTMDKTREYKRETSEETASCIPQDFNFSKPAAKDLLHCILENPNKYEVSEPLKGCRTNRVYTIKGFSSSQINCDDNGAYSHYNTSTHEFVAWFDENRMFSVRGVKNIDGKWIYTERMGRKYIQHEANLKDVYTLKQLYRKSKSFPGLEHRVVTAEKKEDGTLLPYSCVVYIQNNTSNDSCSISVKPHGNSARPDVLEQPYYRTSEAVFTQMDKLLETQSPSLTFDTLLDTSGGPMHSSSISEQPRNQRQMINRKQQLLKQKPATFSNTSENASIKGTNLEKLLAAQRDPKSPVRTVLAFDDCYIAILYSDKVLKDMELFCTSDVGCSIFGIDTTFKLTDMWLTDTSLRNHRLLSTRTGKHPILLGPCMLHFRKSEENFRRFCGELLSASPSLQNLKKVGTDMESAIFGGFQSMLPNLSNLVCVRHIEDRDNKAIDGLLAKSGLKDEQKTRNKRSILNNLYGTCIGALDEPGLAEAENEDDLEMKLNSLKPSWEKLCPGFFKWFISNRKKLFSESVIKSARVGTELNGLYYQNDVESLHAIEKRIQGFKGKDVLGVVDTVKKLMDREENDERLAVYGSGNYVMAPEYSQFKVAAEIWHHSWNLTQREEHMRKLQAFQPLIEHSFVKPVNAGKKPGQQSRKRSRVMPTFVTVPSATGLPPVINQNTPLSSVNNNTTTSRPTSSDTRSRPAVSTTTTTTTTATLPISFPDPRVRKEKSMVLCLRRFCDKKVKRCRGECGEKITAETVLLVRSFGDIPIYDKKTGKTTIAKGNHYIHFDGECLKNYDSMHTNHWYAPDDEFLYGKLTLDPASKAELPQHELDRLEVYGVPV